MSRRNLIRKFPFPGPWLNSGKSWCCYCGERIIVDGKPYLRAQWHKACLRDFNLHTRTADQVAFVTKRDGQRCAWPECGAVAMKWWRGVAYVLRVENFRFSPDVDTSDLWPDPPGRWRDWTIEQRGTGLRQDIERVSALELDHRVPLWSVADLPADQRRPYFGPGNLWLLCPMHHKAKSKSEAAQRAARKSVERVEQIQLL